MSGFGIYGGQLAVVNGARTVATTGGTLLQFLTSSQTFVNSLVFPDANKVEIYAFLGRATTAPGSNYQAIADAQSAVGALPQEWTNAIVLGAAPAGADLFMGRVELTRTVAPSHLWIGQSISPVFPQGVQIPLRGSMIIEQAPAITRSMTLAIQGGNLVALLEQSVGPAAGNFGQGGVWPTAYPATSTNTNRSNENVAPSGAAVPVYSNPAFPYTKNNSWTATTLIGPGGGFANLSLMERYRYGGADAATYADPTNYNSTYSITIRGRFGRRS